MTEGRPRSNSCPSRCAPYRLSPAIDGRACRLDVRSSRCQNPPGFGDERARALVSFYPWEARTIAVAHGRTRTAHWIWLPLRNLLVISFDKFGRELRPHFFRPFISRWKNALDIQNHAINFLPAPDHRAGGGRSESDGWNEPPARQYFPSPLFAFD